MSKSERITAKLLRSLGACSDSVDVFAEEWPRGAAITKKNLGRAVELGLSFDWLAEATLTAPAWAEYERVKAPAWAEYERVKAPAWAEYKRVKAQAWAQLYAIKKFRRPIRGEER